METSHRDLSQSTPDLPSPVGRGRLGESRREEVGSGEYGEGAGGGGGEWRVGEGSMGRGGGMAHLD